MKKIRQKYLDQLYRDGSNFVFGYSDDEILTKKKFEEKKLEGVRSEDGTRLNSSHIQFPYAASFLKKKILL